MPYAFVKEMTDTLTKLPVSYENYERMEGRLSL